MFMQYEEIIRNKFLIESKNSNHFVEKYYISATYYCPVKLHFKSIHYVFKKKRIPLQARTHTNIDKSYNVAP